MQVGLMVNLTQENARTYATSLIDRWQDRGISFLLPEEEGAAFNRPGMSVSTLCNRAEMVIVIGGDGTFLRSARRVHDAGAEVPLFGVNMGHLGFLATSTPESFDDDAQQLFARKGKVTRRRLIEGVARRGTQVKPLYALNDVVLFKGCGVKMISVNVSVCGRSISTVRADGVIFATPTGSTAYALSAGGPIVPPHVPCTILAPLCAHTLYWRPLVLNADDRVTLKLQSEQDSSWSADGLDAQTLMPGEELELWLSHRAVSVMNLPDFDYFDLLHQKLMWGFDPVSGKSDA